MSSAKRRKTEQPAVTAETSLALHSTAPKALNTLPEPNLKLTGHVSPIYSLSFSNSTKTKNTGFLASAGFDKKVLLWNVGGYCCDNYNVLEGSGNAILECEWSKTDNNIYAATADKTALNFDANSGTLVKKYPQTGIVNSLSASKTDECIFVTAGDNREVRWYDTRVGGKDGVKGIKGEWQLTAVELGGEADRMAFVGGIDNKIRAYDFRKVDGRSQTADPVMTLEGHADTISGLKISPDGNYLLSNSMDNTLKCWTVKGFVQGGDSARLKKTFLGHKHGNERRLLKCSWSSDGGLVSCGSSDKVVHVWDVESGDECYTLPGHSASVNDVQFSGGGGVIASGSSDNTIFLGEL